MLRGVLFCPYWIEFSTVTDTYHSLLETSFRRFSEKVVFPLLFHCTITQWRHGSHLFYFCVTRFQHSMEQKKLAFLVILLCQPILLYLAFKYMYSSSFFFFFFNQIDSDFFLLVLWLCWIIFRMNTSSKSTYPIPKLIF